MTRAEGSCACVRQGSEDIVRYVHRETVLGGNNSEKKSKITSLIVFKIILLKNFLNLKGGAALVTQTVKNLPAMQEVQV